MRREGAAMPSPPERQMLEQVWSRMGLLGWTVIVSLLAWVGPAGAAETLPASVRACAALTDSLQRLVCYDREVARFPEPAATTATKPAAAAAKAAPTTPSPSAPSGGASSSASSTPAVTNTTAAAGKDKPAASDSSASHPKDSGRISAHVVTIDRRPSEMVLHLDNGQVWQELQSVSGDLSLREGDTVKIEKHFGSYWLSGPHVSSMRVRQIS
jgi:hypothetical protein